MKRLLPIAHYQQVIETKEKYLAALQKLHQEYNNSELIQKSKPLTRAKFEVENFEIANKIVITKQYIADLKNFHNNIYLPQYEQTKAEVEGLWERFMLLIEPMKSTPSIAKEFDEWSDEDLKNIEVRVLIFKKLRNQVRL
jgi:hypothetical protein